MKRILIVEDNELNRDMLTRRLVRKDYSVASVDDGQKALDYLEQEIPDIILMDMDLPVLNGWQTCQAVRKNQKTRDIPIIALTAHAMSDDKQKAIEAGCNDYATKPIDFPKLIEQIESLT